MLQKHQRRTKLTNTISWERPTPVRFLTAYAITTYRLTKISGNLATCGGGGISPTFGAALWIIDYVLQATLNAVDRLYFHQGTIGNCVRIHYI